MWNDRRRRYLDEYQRSGRNHHGNARVALAPLFCFDNHLSRSHRRCPCLAVHDVRYFGVTRTRLSCQDNPDRSRVYSCRCRAYRGATAARKTQHVFPVPNFQTALYPSLSHLQSMHQSDGSSLSLDEQLRRGWKYETFYALSYIHVVVLGTGFGATWVQLLFLCHRRMYFYHSFDATGQSHDRTGGRNVPIYILHAHECCLWNHDGYRNY